MSAKRQPEVGVHILRTAILQAVAVSRSPLCGGDLVEKFAKSAWTMPPTIKDVRHAVRWLEGRGLVEWRKVPDGPGKELHLTEAGHTAVRKATDRGHGLLERSCQCRQGRAERPTSPASSFPADLGGGFGLDDLDWIAGRRMLDVVQDADGHMGSSPC